MIYRKRHQNHRYEFIDCPLRLMLLLLRHYIDNNGDSNDTYSANKIGLHETAQTTEHTYPSLYIDNMSV